MTIQRITFGILLLLIGGLIGFFIGFDPPSSVLTGLAVSQHQGYIDWKEVEESRPKISFVYVRATTGAFGQDSLFRINWKALESSQMARGAYHYFQPNEPGLEQFYNFAQAVTVKENDMPVMLSVGDPGSLPPDSLRNEVLAWLRLAEAQFGARPTVFVNKYIYSYVLKDYLHGFTTGIIYPGDPPAEMNWTFHQFNDSEKIHGIPLEVGKIRYNGNREELENLSIRK